MDLPFSTRGGAFLEKLSGYASDADQQARRSGRDVLQAGGGALLFGAVSAVQSQPLTPFDGVLLAGVALATGLTLRRHFHDAGKRDALKAVEQDMRGGETVSPGALYRGNMNAAWLLNKGFHATLAGGMVAALTEKLAQPQVSPRALLTVLAVTALTAAGILIQKARHMGVIRGLAEAHELAHQADFNYSAGLSSAQLERARMFREMRKQVQAEQPMMGNAAAARAAQARLEKHEAKEKKRDSQNRPGLK